VFRSLERLIKALELFLDGLVAIALVVELAIAMMASVRKPSSPMTRGREAGTG
jgi:hypothetical protein